MPPTSAATKESASSHEAARYRAFIEQDAAGIVEVDGGGVFLMANARFCAMAGYSEAELLAMRIQDITHPDDWPANQKQFERLRREGVAYTVEKRLLRKDGSEVWVFVSVSLIGSNGTSSFLGVVLDVSPQRRAETAARASEQSYRSLFNSIDTGFCVIEVLFDRAGKPIDYAFLETNAVFESVTGLANVQGRRIRDLAPTHEQHWFDIYGRIALTGEPERFEQEARALNRWYSVYAFRIGEDGSKKVGVLFDDITARRRSEQRRQFLSELSETISSLRDDAAIIRAAVNALGRFMQVDRCYFVECLESENRIVVSENYVREGTPSIASDLSLFDFGGIEWWRKYVAGDFSISDVATNPLTAEKAEAYRALGVGAYLVQPFSQDGPWTVALAVTEKTPREWTAEEAKLVDDVVVRVWPLVERARSERALVAAHAELERRIAERTTALQETVSELESYSYSISHDLRAPLRAMQTYASILRNDCGEQLPADGQEYLRRIITAAERMDRLIRDVLVFSRVTRDPMSLERVDLGPFLSDLIDTYPGLSVGTAQIELVAPFGAVRANPAALTQCLANLLGNAIKFVAPGVKPQLRIWSEVRGSRRRLLIRDNGIGIAADAHDKIFGMFYQIKPGQGGTGVGLAVVRKAAERMGGKVGLISEAGQGSTFWIELENAKELPAL